MVDFLPHGINSCKVHSFALLKNFCTIGILTTTCNVTKYYENSTNLRTVRREFP